MINTDEIMRIALDLAGYRSVPADSAIHVNGSRINKVFVTIDITLAELIFAKNIGCDAVVTHHPIGSSALNFYKVFDRHIDYMVENGIPKESACCAVMSLKERARIKAHAHIYKQIVDEAKLLRMPLVNIHQPCDEIMRKIIYETIISGKTEFVSQIIDSIANIPEFSRAETKIMVCHGDREAKAGRWALVVAAGTNGGFHIAKEYYKHDVSISTRKSPGQSGSSRTFGRRFYRFECFIGKDRRKGYTNSKGGFDIINIGQYVLVNLARDVFKTKGES